MAQIKYTKIELSKYIKKKSLFSKYLPTLQLKKMLLQAEVFKAQTEINAAKEKYNKQYAIVESHAHLLSDPASDLVIDQVQVENIDVTHENIAGIEVPSLRNVAFKQVETCLVTEPIWMEDLVSMIKVLKKAAERVRIAKEKKRILEEELRTISIRVNLFEKRLIPETTKIIKKIKVFLHDQDLQAVAAAKVSKNKILQRDELEVV